MANGQTQGGPRGGTPRQTAAGVDAKAISQGVLACDPAKIDAGAEEVARELVRRGLGASQIRNFYGTIEKIRAAGDITKQVSQLKLNRARLAYLNARASGKAEPLWAVFEILLRRATEGREVEAVCNFAEAIVAYHKYHDWKTKG